jgi:hypothetical protein
MKYKIYFASNARRVIEADHYAVDDNTLVFIKDEQPVLTCPLANVNCWFPAMTTPSRSMHKSASSPLRSKVTRYTSS